jgi:hypothetical protein
MDKQQAQQAGARDHASPGQPHNDPTSEDFPVRLMYVHGWRTGHKSCACQVFDGDHRNVNATVDMTVDGA